MSAALAQMIDGVVIHRFEITKEVTTIGRLSNNDITIDDSAVSSSHAHILLEANRHFPDYQEIFIEDFDSTNGTFLNDQPLTGKQRLKSGDIIRIAWNIFKFIDENEGKLEKTLHMAATNKL